jgi:hypothetical protein
VFARKGKLAEGECTMIDRNLSRHGARAISPFHRAVLRAAAIALVMASALASAHAATTHGALDRNASAVYVERHAAPIVNGRRIQPTPADLARPDISARSARDVDELYRQLMNSGGR